MWYMAETIFVQAANLSLIHHNSYLEHLKPGVKLDMWCALRNYPLQHTVLFPDAAIAKEEEDIAKTEADLCSSQPGSGSSRGGCGGNQFQPYGADWPCCEDRKGSVPGYACFALLWKQVQL